MRRLTFFTLLGALFLSAQVSLASPTVVASKSSAIEQLQSWQMETKSRTDLDEREQDLRLQLISRLIFQVERKYQDSNLPGFMIQILKNMAKTDQKNESFGSMEFFFVNLSVAMQELMERKENPIDFARTFTEFSGISEPSTLEEFSETRQYYDGAGMYQAKPLNLEEAADWVDQRERVLLAQPDLLKFDRNLQEELRIEQIETQVLPEKTVQSTEVIPSDLTLQNSSNPNPDNSLP